MSLMACFFIVISFCNYFLSEIKSNWGCKFKKGVGAVLSHLVLTSITFYHSAVLFILLNVDYQEFLR